MPPVEKIIEGCTFLPKDKPIGYLINCEIRIDDNAAMSG
jgi:hypothetical protein